MRGAKSRTVPALFDEFAAALQFPPYFGENWDALEECLADLAWLSAKAVVLLLRDGTRLLDGEPEREAIRLWSLIARVAGAWNCPMEGPARAFHVVVHCQPDQGRVLREKLAQWNVLSFLDDAA
jgi:hypothetical protein